MYSKLAVILGSGAVCPSQWRHLSGVLFVNQRGFFALGGLTRGLGKNLSGGLKPGGEARRCDSTWNRPLLEPFQWRENVAAIRQL